MSKIRVAFRKSKRWAEVITTSVAIDKAHKGMDVAIVEAGVDPLRPHSEMTYLVAYNTKVKGWVGEQSSGGRSWGDGLFRYWKALTGQTLPENVEDMTSAHELKTEEKLGVTQFRGIKVVSFISRTETEATRNLCDPAVLYETLKQLRREGKRIHLPDHPTEKSPMGYPHMCFGKASGCNQCVKCIMDYYKEEVEEAKKR